MMRPKKVAATIFMNNDVGLAQVLVNISHKGPEAIIENGNEWACVCSKELDMQKCQ